MAAQKSSLPVQRHIVGDMCCDLYFLGPVADGDTLATSQKQILFVVPNPSTAVTVGSSFGTTSTVTFHSSAPWSGNVAVFSRVG